MQGAWEYWTIFLFSLLRVRFSLVGILDGNSWRKTLCKTPPLLDSSRQQSSTILPSLVSLVPGNWLIILHFGTQLQTGTFLWDNPCTRVEGKSLYSWQRSKHSSNSLKYWNTHLVWLQVLGHINMITQFTRENVSLWTRRSVITSPRYSDPLPVPANQLKTSLVNQTWILLQNLKLFHNRIWLEEKLNCLKSLFSF